jgi:5-hydroxyisourate hydrolase
MVLAAGGISLHAVDVARGVPAAGLEVELWALAPQRRLVAQGALAANGQLEHPSVQGDGIAVGEYEALFHVGDYLRAQGGADASPFLDVLPFRFWVRDLSQHLHLPLKFTAWGCALFRGS